jgi:hypothetical protein
MKSNRRNLYTLAGLGMIVGAFFSAAKAIGGLVALVYFAASTDFTDLHKDFGENVANTWKAGHTSEMVHGVGSFLILFWGGRWMLRGPKLLDSWIEGDRTQDEAESPQDKAKANKP